MQTYLRRMHCRRQFQCRVATIRPVVVKRSTKMHDIVAPVLSPVSTEIRAIEEHEMYAVVGGSCGEHACNHCCINVRQVRREKADHLNVPAGKVVGHFSDRSRAGIVP